MIPLLTVRHLRVTFPKRREVPALTVVRDVSFDVKAGECTTLVGESGCGKSLSAMALTRLPPLEEADIGGSVSFCGENLLGKSPEALRAFRGRRIAYIFQDPGEALNPVLRVRTQLEEALPPGMDHAAREAELVSLIHQVRISDAERVLRSYPHELSGGMQQRVMIAMALASRPELLVADEPTSALDATTQVCILDLLDEVRRARGMGVLLITHNLGVVARYAQTAAVLYAGETVESGPSAELLASPRHPYTQGLLAAVPRLTMRRVDELHGIPGRVPPPTEWGEGCVFAPRCRVALPSCQARCYEQEFADGRKVKCISSSCTQSEGMHNEEG